jgi:glycosyltransferase involved in cell wall biosynthesis
MRFFLLTYAHEEGIRVNTGGLRKVWELARYLGKAGHDAWVFIPKAEKPKIDIPAPCVSYPVIETKILRPLSAYLMLFLKPLFHAFCHKPDYIYFRTCPTVLPIFLAWLTGARLILEINGDALTERRGQVATFWKDRIHYFRVKLICIAEKMNARAAEVVITLTKGLKDIIVKRYSIPSEKVVVIESGTNTEHCRPMDSRECRRVLRLDEQKHYVAFIGVLYSHQGIDTLIDAAPEVLRICPDVVFLVGGGGPMAEQWQNKIREKNLSAAFRFFGVVPYEQLPVFLNSADICVAPFTKDRGETSPLKLFDYMACGKATVCSDIPSVRFLAKESRGILTFRPDDSHALALALITLLDDDSKVARLGDAGRKYVEAHHSWEIIANKITDSIK